MAQQQNNEQQPPSHSSEAINPLISGMARDVNDTYLQPGMWSYARNASKVTPIGDLQTLSNEQANFLCQSASYPIIGVIHLFADKWAVFSTNVGTSPLVLNPASEIGYFEDSICKYTILVSDPCKGPTSATNIPVLNFSQQHLIGGASKQNFDCTWSVYFTDGFNVDRFVRIDVSGPVPIIVNSGFNNQFISKCTGIASFNSNPPVSTTWFSNNPPSTLVSCETCVPTCSIDPDLIRLASLVESPCVTCSKSRTPGSLLNGSYFATIRYTINEQPYGDFFPPSNSQPLFSHQNESGALQISFSELDTINFTEFELVIVRNVNLQTTAKRIGIYSTFTQEVLLASIAETLPDIPIEQIPIRTPVFEKSEAIYPVGNYLIRVAPTSKFDFNYQPLANRINAFWNITEYPQDYYKQGGNKPSFLRDEIYSFFIRWVFDTGDRSSSYHIPGRGPSPTDLAPATNAIDNIEQFVNPQNWQINNTAAYINDPNTSLIDGGVVIARGTMGYWQSTEIYPPNEPDVWNLSFWVPPNTVNTWPDAVSHFPQYDLCGTPIRHHKMLDNLTLGGSALHPDACAHFHTYPSGATNIRLLGVEFDNIALPLDNNGNLIQGVVAYEILRGSREGNKTVIAKGMINNMRTYNTVVHPFPVLPDGLYQNYPYNDLSIDNTLSAQETTGGLGINNYIPMFQSRDDIFTFHSPDTQFKHPFLATNEMKVYGRLLGEMQGAFDPVPGHPKEKIITNLAFIVSAIVGLAEAGKAVYGRRVTTTPQLAAGGGATGIYSTSVLGAAAIAPALAADDAALAVYAAALGTYINARNTVVGTATAAEFDPSINAPEIALETARLLAADVPGIYTPAGSIEREDSQLDYLGAVNRILGGVVVYSTYWSIGTDTALRLIEAIVPFTDYAYRFLSTGFYNTIDAPFLGFGSERRYALYDLNYLDSTRQSFNDRQPGAIYPTLSINNLYRPQAVVLQTQNPISLPPVNANPDRSYCTIGDNDIGYSTPQRGVTRPLKSYYTALIQRLSNQYGQIDSIQQIPIGCNFDIDTTIPNYQINQSTSEIFGGDTYVCRYTEKNTFFYFWNWLYNLPDGYEYNYRTGYMITYPRFWADFTRYEAGDFLSLNFATMAPSSKASLDRTATTGSFFQQLFALLNLSFRVSDAYFYLFQSGVRDFFVESEVNTELRDYGDVPEERFYDPYGYTDTYALFDTKIIKSANYYKYDFSLSLSRQFQTFTSWGNIQPRDYDPFIAASCYVTRPNRVIYSLPQHLEDEKDYWRVFLINNYRDFYSPVSAVKSINKSGAIFLFKYDSPIEFQGVDQLQTELGTKVTLGDGGLFSQPDQSVANVDTSYEYGSCQDRLSIINTPFGLYYICANQGKIFKKGGDMSRIYRGQGALDDITYSGLKFWFKEYLPFWILKDFPSFSILDNPLAGIGCQSIYDNQIETIYFCKKDWYLLDQYRLSPGGPPDPAQITYLGTNQFRFTGPLLGQVFFLGDPRFFKDASWTVSYDPKAEKGGWISYHDWHPDLNIPSKNNFLTTKGSQIWRHNDRTDLFCNYYGTQFPYEVEYIASTQLSVNTLRSIEYYLECYKYNPGTLDRYHILDEGFDHAVVYNTEQTSGLLTLIDKPKGDPFGNLAYPILPPGGNWNILYDKVEQRYRFNTWWDLTRDRGEYPQYPLTGAQQMIWFTDPNGYTRTLNAANIDYNKPPFQRKKFRHYLTKVWMQKLNPGSSNYVVKAFVEKDLLSMR